MSTRTPLPNRVSEIATTSAWSVVHRLEDRFRFDLVPRRYWSPIPKPLPAGLWDQPSELAGLAPWDLDAQAAFAGELEPLMPARSDELCRSEFYGDDDARVLYAMVRHRRPARLVELGSGHSTKIIRAAIARDEIPCDHRCYDPYPGFTGTPTPGFHIEPLAMQDIPMEVFTGLREGDVLFVDTTHTVKAGSDVNRLILDVLPRLAAGVLVHIHDIFLPYEYPREWLEDMRLYWAEQYLLQAFLSGNDGWDVVLAAHALARAGRVLRGRPSGFWMQPRAAAG